MEHRRVTPATSAEQTEYIHTCVKLASAAPAEPLGYIVGRVHVYLALHEYISYILKLLIVFKNYYHTRTYLL
jgi:hypothetical protein